MKQKYIKMGPKLPRKDRKI